MCVKFQFTPLREGRRITNAAYPFGFISIHAPTRGATIIIAAIALTALFQFTPLREGRRMPPDGFVEVEDISIHAPTRGATGSQAAAARRTTLFQFTPLREGRPRDGANYVRTQKDFNSRPYARGDVPMREPYKISAYFNSRPYARGDRVAAWKPWAFTCISIHAHTRGATAWRELGTNCHLISIHAHTRGATFGLFQLLADELISIHAHTRGATAKDMRLKQIFCSILTNHPTPAGASCNLQGSFL